MLASRRGIRESFPDCGAASCKGTKATEEVVCFEGETCHAPYLGLMIGKAGEAGEAGTFHGKAWLYSRTRESQ